jgi:hypothetical protein
MTIEANPALFTRSRANIVKRLPWLEKVDATLVSQELRDRAEQCDPRARAELDVPSLLTPGKDEFEVHSHLDAVMTQFRCRQCS